MRTRKMVLGALLIASLAGALGLALLPTLVQAAPETLPPRPPTPTPTQATSQTPSRAPTGALIILETTFDNDWPSRGLAWQDLWTMVQWQDGNGAWHDVEGWQGTLDEVEGSLGWKTWWLAPDIFGRGPFRWVVYEQQDGPVMVISESFHLPDQKGGSRTVEVALP